MHHGPGPFVSDAGTVFGFRTSPLYEDSPPETGRYGALVVLGHDDHIVVLGVLDGVWASMPTLDEVSGRELLRCNRYSSNNKVAVFGGGVKDVPTLEKLTAVGQVPLTAEQVRISEQYLGGDFVGRTFSHPDVANNHVEGEWRWEHDREALLHERELKDQRRERARAAAERRYVTRLKDLTWEQLLSETPFVRWDLSPPFPPAEFRDAAAARVHDTCRALQALGVKPRKPATRKLLKDLVLWFNEADERAGGVIETEEREDICLVLEEILHLARHPSLIDEANAWRDW